MKTFSITLFPLSISSFIKVLFLIFFTESLKPLHPAASDSSCSIVSFIHCKLMSAFITLLKSANFLVSSSLFDPCFVWAAPAFESIHHSCLLETLSPSVSPEHPSRSFVSLSTVASLVLVFSFLGLFLFSQYWELGGSRPSCVILERLFNLFDPQIPHL